MDTNKKQQNYSRSGNSKTGTEIKKSSSDIQSSNKHHWPKNSRCENPQTSSTRNNNNNTSKQQQQPTKARPNVDKRPRARGHFSNNHGYSGSSNDYFAASSRLASGHSTAYASSGEGAVGRYESNYDYELDFVHSPGNKKQNLNHLLNFYYTPRDVDHHDGAGGGYNGTNIQRHSQVKKHKYNKEQFLQANFQFVIKASARRKTNDSPDTLIDWSLIEQINIQTPEEPQCPICLYPPIAAKVTRCGHVYCWSCILHYLSLSDKTWRKCPICYDAVHVGDLKSASIVQQKSYNVGSQITFRLMRRKKGSLIIEKYENWKDNTNLEKYPYISSPTDEKLFSKFILAKRNDIADIVARERHELLTDADESCPEFVFIQQALELLRERSDKLGEIETRDDILISDDVQQRSDNESFNVDIREPSYKDSKGNEDQPLDESSAIVNGDKIISEISSSTTREKDVQLFDEYVAIGNEDVSNAEGKVSEIPSTKLSSSFPTLKKYYYFYQVDDGQNIYIHPINVKMLQASHGCLANAPPVIKARILQKEHHSMDEEHRRKFTCLGHLPLTCQFSVVEIELLPPYVSEDVIKSFKAEIVHRKKERQRRAREEREREKHINAINDRQMGKLIASTANINITSSDEFPTCGFEESLSPLTEPADNIPSTSKGSRRKTISTSSAGSCSYSSIAIHCQQDHTPWVNATPLPKTSNVIIQSEDDVEISVPNCMRTNLGDVLAEALSQQKIQKETDKFSPNIKVANAAKNKKSKKSKKMVPLYSTGMNFGAN